MSQTKYLPGSPIDWTKEEEKLLRKVYQREGLAAAAEHFPDRTKDAVLGKAQRMKLRPPQKWSQREKDYLKKYYGLVGPAQCAKYLKKKNIHVVKKMAHKLGLEVGLVDGHVRAVDIDYELGLSRGSTKRHALREGVGKSVGAKVHAIGNGGRKVYVVPQDWADDYSERMRRSLEADTLFREWYTVPRVARILQVTEGSVRNSLKGRGPHADCFEDITILRCSPRHNNCVIFNPWQIEELGSKIRRDTPILSKQQRAVMEHMASTGHYVCQHRELLDYGHVFPSIIGRCMHYSFFAKVNKSYRLTRLGLRELQK